MAAQSIRSTGGAAQTIPKNRSPEKDGGQIPQGAAVSKPPELGRWAVWKAPLLGMNRALVAAATSIPKNGPESLRDEINHRALHGGQAVERPIHLAARHLLTKAFGVRRLLTKAPASESTRSRKNWRGGVADPARALRYVKNTKDAKSRRGQRPRPPEESMW